jgi:hypothetical protein
VSRRGWAAGAVALAAALAAPASAGAHGIAQREDLPVPQWLFAWAAAAVLVASFVALGALWPAPRLERPGWRPLPGGRALASGPVRAACGAVGVVLLVVTVLAGYVGGASALDNFAPTFILIWFWVGLVFASALLGDVFAALSPWRALGRVLPSRERPYPPQLGRWPAALGLLAFGWVELGSGWGDHPARLVTAAVVYTVLTLAAQAWWGVETWTRRGEAFAVYFNLFARLSPFETRDAVVGVRPPLGGLPRLDPAPGTVALVCVMIGTVTFDGLGQGPLWREAQPHVVDAFAALGLGATAAPMAAAALGLLACVALIGAFYRVGIDGVRSVGGKLGAPKLREAFVHTLVPIAAVYVAAHYLTFLLFEGQAIGYLASDPFGQGWNLFGTATAGIDYTWFPQSAIWYVQVALVVAGHVAGLVLAHDRALVLYRDPGRALRSQYWMLGVMVGFTSLALWLLSAAGS